MGNEMSSEGMTRGKPTTDRMTVKQVVDILNLYSAEIKSKCSPSTWPKIELLIERARQLEQELSAVTLTTAVDAATSGYDPNHHHVHPKEDLVPEPDPILYHTQIYRMGKYGVDIIREAVKESTGADEDLIVQGASFHLLEFILDLAEEALGSYAPDSK
jgi:hypothetical protein